MKACKECGSTTKKLSYPGPRDLACHRAVVKARKARAQTSRDAKVYGLAEGAYEALLEIQGGTCPICQRGDGHGAKRFAIDHDHATGAVRGALHSECNRLLGWARDNPEVFDRAAAYLRNPPANRLDPKFLLPRGDDND